MKITKNIILGLFILPLIFCIISCNNKKIKTVKSDVRNELQNKLGWFHEAKFGLFIHWGLYAVPAGEWDGKKSYGEWIQYSANIPGLVYEKLAKQFNPVKFNAKDWVTLAKKAGMKYIVITTKHHEGFCMYNSRLTDYDIVDATPYGKDPMKELAEECKKEGIKLCFYYSIQDWHNPDYPVRYTYYSKDHPEGFHGFPNPEADYKKYFSYMSGQVKELLTNYGPVGIIWFDWPGVAFDSCGVNQNCKMARNLVDSIHKWQPTCLINNRLGGNGADYGTPEQEIPGGTQKTAFEVCMTLNDHWGYNKNDHNWKSAKDIVYNLCDIAAKGGNYLLNVGPTAEGVIPDKSKEILAEVGKWLAINGEAIFNTSPGGPSVRWNVDVKMITTKPGTWYLHVFNWPKDNKVYIEFNGKFETAYLLADKSMKPLDVDVHTRGLMIHLPSQPVDSLDNVVVLKFGKN